MRSVVVSEIPYRLIASVIYPELMMDRAVTVEERTLLVGLRFQMISEWIVFVRMAFSDSAKSA